MNAEVGRQMFLVAFVAAAAVFDVRTGRIPNWLCVVGFAAGIAWTVFFAGAEGAVASALPAFAIGFGAVFILYLFKGVGGGDVKLMAGYSLLAGYPGIIYCLFFGCLAAGALMLAPLAWRGELLARIRNGLRRAKNRTAMQPVSVSFAMALLIGLVWVLVMEAL